MSLPRTRRKIKGQIYNSNFLSSIKLLKNQKFLKTFEKSQGKNVHTSQCMHVKNHTYVNKSRHTYVCDGQ